MVTDRQREIEQELRQTGGYRTWVTRRPPGLLYHYTPLESGVEILTSRQIWATNLSRVDDSSELLHASRVLARTAQNMESSLGEEKIYPYWKPPRTDETGKKSWTRMGPYSNYALCLSEDPDDRHQWERYGNGGWGLALGFTDSQLGLETDGIRGPRVPDEKGRPVGKDIEMTFLRDNEALFVGPVIYDREEKHELFEDLLRKAEEFYEEHPRETRFALRQVVGEVSPFMKGPSYRDEAEWRVFRLELQSSSADEVQFRQEAGMLKPYVEVDFGEVEDGDDPLPVGIVAGPGLTPAIHGRSLRRLCERARQSDSNVARPELRWMENEDVAD